MNLSLQTAASTGSSRTREPKVAYVLDPRFQGGTSAAVARELETVSKTVNPQIFGISSQMFSGRHIAPSLHDALRKSGTELIWDPPTIVAETVILHNPAFLKFQTQLDCNILAHRLLVVAHENFTRPGGALGFDIGGCLGQIDNSSLAKEKFIAPISPHNRETVVGWLAENPEYGSWQVLDADWFNICDFDFEDPTATPQDRRGRLSRPGFEKFPSLNDLETCFPKTAASNIILGADSLMAQAPTHPHWEMIPFRGVTVGEFFERVDFMIYFTAPNWRESFGRVIAEATAAGKVVITDSGTRAVFGEGVLTALPDEVDSIIADLVRYPKKYAKTVRAAQQSLTAFGPAQFLKMYLAQLVTNQGVGT